MCSGQGSLHYPCTWFPPTPRSWIPLPSPPQKKLLRLREISLILPRIRSATLLHKRQSLQVLGLVDRLVPCHGGRGDNNADGNLAKPPPIARHECGHGGTWHRLPPSPFGIFPEGETPLRFPHPDAGSSVGCLQGGCWGWHSLGSGGSGGHGGKPGEAVISCNTELDGDVSA